MDALVVGLDLGTTLCKATAFTLGGKEVCSTQKNIVTYRPQSGWAEQDPNHWVQAIVDVLRRLVSQLGKQADRIKVIGVSSHGPSVIFTNGAFQPFGLSPIWQDQRAVHLLDELIELAGDDWIGLGTPESSFGLQLYWCLQNEPEIIKKAAHLFDVKGFLLTILTGELVDEPSSSPGGRNVNQGLFEALGIDFNLLPFSTSSQSIVGSITLEIQAKTNLPPHVQVVAGLNDGAAATLGAGLVNLGQGIVSLSTNGVMRTIVPNKVPGSTLREKSMFCYSYVDDKYVAGGMTKCGGDSVRWLAENFYHGQETDARLFSDIEENANRSPVGANGVFFMPYLVGMGTPTPTKRSQGALLKLGRHHTRADVTRAVLEGAVFALKDISITFDQLGLSWEDLRFTGGGSKNLVWRQIVADILGKPLSGVSADSLLGAAIVGATGYGFYPTIIDAISSMTLKTFYVEPIKENILKYQDLFGEYKKYKRLIQEIG